MQKIVLTFGLIAGAILSGMMLITMPFHEQIGFDKGLIIGYTTMVLAFLMIFAGIKSYRDNVGGGNVSFGRALAVGLSITAIASVCYVATWQFVYHRMIPDYLEKYTAYEVAKERAAGASDAQILAKTKELQEFEKAYQNPLVNIAYTLLEPLPVGIVFSLVAAGVMSRKRRGHDSSALNATIANVV
jgi:hypothetical protein